MSKVPVLEIEFSDGRVFHVRAAVIAEDRARYLANNDHPGGGSLWRQAFEAEFDYALADNAELLDWASNNTNWEDVAMQALEVTIHLPNRAAEWSNAEKRILR